VTLQRPRASIESKLYLAVFRHTLILYSFHIALKLYILYCQAHWVLSAIMFITAHGIPRWYIQRWGCIWAYLLISIFM